MTKDSEAGKLKFALFSIVLSLSGIALGFVFRTPLMNAFTPGTLCSLTGMVLSMMAIRNKGSNFPAQLAFWLSTAGVFITVALGAK